MPEPPNKKEKGKDMYKHYGVEVIRQSLNHSFKSDLRNKDIQYTELAVKPNLDIITYVYEEKKRYAIIAPVSLPDEYWENVYITSQTPDDCNWENLVTDIEGQVNGEEPQKRKTRLKMLLESAEKEADKEGFSYLENEEKYLLAIKMFLLRHGITVEEIKYMETHDIDTEYLERVMEV